MRGFSRLGRSPTPTPTTALQTHSTLTPLCATVHAHSLSTSPVRHPSRLRAPRGAQRHPPSNNHGASTAHGHAVKLYLPASPTFKVYLPPTCARVRCMTQARMLCNRQLPTTNYQHPPSQPPAAVVGGWSTTASHKSPANGSQHNQQVSTTNSQPNAPDVYPFPGSPARYLQVPITGTYPSPRSPPRYPPSTYRWYPYLPTESSQPPTRYLQVPIPPTNVLPDNHQVPSRYLSLPKTSSQLPPIPPPSVLPTTYPSPKRPPNHLSLPQGSSRPPGSLSLP